ncbi:MAG: FAD-dependent oxidoreductase [Fimbriimonadaceae bacterium]|nr:FAD-dependent oxidoreductase [Alphaproteobacteria bacterium]
MATNLDIRLNHPVDRIEYEEGDSASVCMGEGVFESDSVICACPLGVLQNGDIAFDPPLPKDVRAGIDRIGMGNVTKIALKFDAAHWSVDTQYFGLMTEEKGRWNYFLNYRTFFGPEYSPWPERRRLCGKVEQLSDVDMAADAVQAVRTMFGAGVPDPGTYRTTRWSRNGFTRGAYSYAKVGSKPADFNRLAKPVANTLLFAGNIPHSNITEPSTALI